MKVNTDVLPKLTLTVEEAAELLRIGRGSAYELVRSGRLRAVKIGRRILIPSDAINEFCTPHKTQGSGLRRKETTI